MTTFSRPAERIRGCILAGNVVITAQVHYHYKLSCGQAEFPKILSQNTQHDLEGQGHRPRFSISAASIPWCMVQNFWFHFKAVTSYRVDKVVNRQPDGRTQATTIPLRPERTRGKNDTHNRKQVASYWCWHSWYETLSKAYVMIFWIPLKEVHPISAIILHAIFQSPWKGWYHTPLYSLPVYTFLH